MRLRLLRTVAFAIALLVPLQGMTAVMAGQCMVFGHHESSAGHDGHDQSMHSHSDEAGTKADGDPGAPHCGPCTACCASASITGPAALSIPSDWSNSPYVFSQFPPLVVQPSGLDRPPLAL